MKKLVCLLLVFAFLLSLVACGGTDVNSDLSSVNDVIADTDVPSEIVESGPEESEPAESKPAPAPTQSKPAEQTPAHTHSYSATVTKAPTCGKTGVKTFKCSCGRSYTETIAATGAHNWAAASCKDPKTCTVCRATEGAKGPHGWLPATCKAPKTCAVCGITEGSKAAHKYNKGKCSVCGEEDENYVEVFGVGDTVELPGVCEITINSVIQHELCADNYDAAEYGATTAVIVNYTYKNIGSGKLKVYDDNFEVYDQQGAQGDHRYFEIFCDHGVEAGNAIPNGTVNAKLPVSLQNSSDFVTIYVEVDGIEAVFKVNVTEPTAEDKAEMVEYSRVKGEFTYKYNDFVGTRGDSGAKVLFVPKNPDLKTQDNKNAMMLMDKKYESGIIVEKCDGYGKFDTGVDYIPAGEYVVVVVSKNTNNSGKMTKEELSSYLGEYISDADLETLATFIGFSKCAINDMTLQSQYEHTISNDFGVTYF